MHKIYITKGRVGQRGLLYDVEYEGDVICRSSLTPLLDACRMLRAGGLAGKIEMWDREGLWPRMTSTIEGAAQLAIADRGSGPIFTKWRPRDFEEAVEGGDCNSD